MHQPHAETLAWRHGVVRPGQARGEREGIVWTHLQNYTQFSSRLSHWRRYVNNSTVVVMVCRGLWITSSPQSAYCVRHCLYVTSKWRTIVITVVSVLMSNTSVNSRRQPPPSNTTTTSTWWHSQWLIPFYISFLSHCTPPGRSITMSHVVQS